MNFVRPDIIVSLLSSLSCKKNQFNWGIFDDLNVTLSRMDVCYFRGTKLNDQNELVEDLMEKCCQRVKTKDKRRKAE